MKSNVFFLSLLLSITTVAASSTPSDKTPSDITDDVLAHVLTPMLDKKSCLNLALANKETRGFVNQNASEVNLSKEAPEEFYGDYYTQEQIEELKKVMQRFPNTTCLTGAVGVFEAMSSLLDKEMDFNVINHNSRTKKVVAMKPFSKVNTINFSGRIRSDYENVEGTVRTFSKFKNLKNFKWSYKPTQGYDMMRLDTASDPLVSFFSTLEKVTLDFANKVSARYTADDSEIVGGVPEDGIFRRLGMLFSKAINLKELDCTLVDEQRLSKVLIDPSFVNSLTNLEKLTLNANLAFETLDFSNLRKLKKFHITFANPIYSPWREGLEQMVLNNPNLVDFSLGFWKSKDDPYPIDQVVSFVKTLKERTPQWKHLQFMRHYQQSIHIKSEAPKTFNIASLWGNPEFSNDMFKILNSFFDGNTGVEALHINLDDIDRLNHEMMIKLFNAVPNLKHLRFYSENNRKQSEPLMIGLKKALPFEVAAALIKNLDQKRIATLESFDIEFNPDLGDASIATIAMDLKQKGFSMTVVPADPQQGRENAALKFVKS